METITHEALYQSLINGAKEVMHNRMFLNKINVFPVADGDTGSNLFSTMQSIVFHSELGENAKTTLESIADSAIVGARGNSGLIFAQYFQGLSEAIEAHKEVTKEAFIEASKIGMDYAYQAIEKPVEGTMLTIMKAFHEALHQGNQQIEAFDALIESALTQVDIAVDHTTNQLKILQQSSVVDSGAKGFAYFIKGFLDGLKGKLIVDDALTSDEVLPEIEHDHEDDASLHFRYCTEALVEKHDALPDLKESLRDLGDSIVQVNGKHKVRVHVHTNEPSQVFERLSHYGKILEQKVDDMVGQYNRVHHRKYQTVIVTDSIADLPQQIIDDEQIHVVNLSILVGDEAYLDKLTVTNDRLFTLAKEKNTHPTSSQPTIKSIENTYRYLLSYYDHIVVFTVASALSGTYNVFMQAKSNFDKDQSRIHVIDTKQNSVAEGLLVYEAVEQFKNNQSLNQIIEQAKQSIKQSKILVKINTLDNMIASGRLSVKAGRLAKKVGLRPIITLDENGDGGIFKIAFNPDKALKKILKHVKQLDETKGIKYYAVTYVDNESLGQAFTEALTSTLGRPPVYTTESSGIIAMGAGRGAVAVSYITRDE